MNSSPKASQPREICIVRLSAIGDCCHTVPVIRTIQAAWPGTKITWVIGKVEHELMSDMDGVELVVFDKKAGLSGYRTLRKKLKGRHFPILLNMHASMRANLVSRCVSADRRIGFDRARARDYQWLFCNEKIPARAEQHVMDGLFEFAAYLGIENRELRWDIPLDDDDQQFAAEVCDHEGPVCVISPCSSQRARNFRNWSVGNYVALAKYLSERYAARIVLTGGPTDTERRYGEEIASKAGFEVENLVGTTSLKQLLAILADADLLVCPDSGPAHMATAAGTPVVGLYATSNRHRTGPYLSQDLVADRYPDAVQLEFGKPVSELRWGQRVRDPDAMSLITLSDVTEKVDQALG